MAILCCVAQKATSAAQRNCFHFRPYYLLIIARETFQELLVTAIVDTPPGKKTYVRSIYGSHQDTLKRFM